MAAGTEIHLRLLEAVASQAHKRGDQFKLEVAQPIAVDESIIVPTGSPAIGEVVHAAKPGMSGKAGELILATRSVSVGEHEIKLSAFGLEAPAASSQDLSEQTCTHVILACTFAAIAPHC